MMMALIAVLSLVQRFQKTLFLQFVQNTGIDKPPWIGGLRGGHSIESLEDRSNAIQRRPWRSQHVPRLQCPRLSYFLAVFRARPLLNDIDAEFFILEIGFHPFEKCAHKAPGRIALAFDEPRSRDDGSRHVRLVDLRQVEQLGEPEAL